jgi:hypothetical protein
MTLEVPYIGDDAIEHDAEALLAQYAYAKGVEMGAPILIEDVVEKHLKLHVEFDDLHRLLNVPRSGPDPDIFGAIWLDSGEIVIDESLDPEERPAMEGRYRFTLAHEGGGHWRLHRPFLPRWEDQMALFSDREQREDTRKPTVICRSSQAKERVELQADLYASCLLMPRKLIYRAWRDRFGNCNSQRILRPGRTAIPPDIHDELAVALRSSDQSRDDEALEEFARPFAQQFLVSPIAMRIRLEKLGLLLRESPRQRNLITGS